jgi:hypothetical protein
MTPQERLDRAQAAKFVLDSPAYIEAWGKFIADIRSLRLQLSPRDVEGASRLVFMEQAVEKSKRLMDQYLQDGEIARKELEKEVWQGPVGRLTSRLRRVSSQF